MYRDSQKKKEKSNQNETTDSIGKKSNPSWWDDQKKMPSNINTVKKETYCSGVMAQQGMRL